MPQLFSYGMMWLDTEKVCSATPVIRGGDFLFIPFLKLHLLFYLPRLRRFFDPAKAKGI